MPCSPVAALALPELTITARTESCSSWSRQTRIGAAAAAFFVRRIEDVTSSESQATSPRSVLPSSFRPQGTPPARKPGASSFGSSCSTPAGASTHFDRKKCPSLISEPQPFVEAEDQVQVLDRLAGRALPEVVDRGEDEDPVVTGDHLDVALVGVPDVPHARRGIDDLHERLAEVPGFVELVEVFLGQVDRRLDVTADQLALVDRHEVRHEGQRRDVGGSESVQLLEDLGPVPVADRLVRGDVLGDRDERGCLASAPARAGHAGLGVDHDVVDQPGFGERRQRQDGRGRIAAGVGDQFGVLHRVPVSSGRP